MLFPISKYEIRLNDPCGRLHCGPGWRRTRENSLNLNDVEFWLVWKGRGTMHDGKTTHNLSPGFCALMRPGGIYDAEHDEKHPLGITFLHFDVLAPKPSRRIVTNEVCASWPEFFNLEDVPFFDAISRRIAQHFQPCPDTAQSLMKGMLADLLLCPPIGQDLVQEGKVSAHRQRILQLASDIRSNYDPANASVARMAAQLHLSHSHFSRLFLRITGQSPMQFFLETRLAQARHLLRETDLSIGEIADRLGYRDLFFFSRQFTQKEGIPPSRYRAR